MKVAYFALAKVALNSCLLAYFKAKSDKELQFQGEKRAAGDVTHLRLPIPDR